jgi:hypothetical protein
MADTTTETHVQGAGLAEALVAARQQVAANLGVLLRAELDEDGERPLARQVAGPIIAALAAELAPTRGVLVRLPDADTVALDLPPNRAARHRRWRWW